MSNLNSIVERCKHAWSGSGQGTVSLGSVVDGFEDLANVLSDGSPCTYEIQHLTSTEYEKGSGTYSAGAVTRESVVRSTDAGQKVHFTAGPKEILVEVTADRIVKSDSSGVVRIKTVTLTDAQIKALPTTLVEIVPAPAAGTRLVLVNSLWLLNSAAGVYTNIDATQSIAQLIYYDLSETFDASVFTDENNGINFFGGSPLTGKVAVVPPASNPAPNGSNYVNPTAAQVGNWIIALKAYNGASGNFTGGDATNTLKVTVVYVVIDL